MYAFIDFLLLGFKNIIKVLNTQMFSDFPITYLQLILSSIVIGVIFKFAFGGMKEFEGSSNGFIFNSAKSVSKSISNKKREEQVINNNRNEFVRSSNDFYDTFYVKKGKK